MMQPRCERDVGAFEAALAAERARLVRLCARITGDADAAEDLAQETLVEAWRARGRLRDPGGLSPWLAAIARNVCLRWARGRGRRAGARRAEIAAAGLDGTPPTLDDCRTATKTSPLTLERGELAELLDRALALLPAQTRAALVESYVYDGHRGSWRRGWAAARARCACACTAGGWRCATRSRRTCVPKPSRWESRCRDQPVTIPTMPASQSGARHASGARSVGGTARSRASCPRPVNIRITAPAAACRAATQMSPAGIVVGMARDTTVAAGLTSAKSILSRLLADNDTRYRRGLAEGAAICLDCGQPGPVRLWTPADTADMGPLTYGINLACDHCRGGDNASLWHLMIDLPAGRRFWRRHPHMRALPIREISYQGRPALLAGFESGIGRHGWRWSRRARRWTCCGSKGESRGRRHHDRDAAAGKNSRYSGSAG